MKIRTCLISLYPSTNTSQSAVSGVASYTKHLVDNMNTAAVTVFANKITPSIPETNNGNYNVSRVWQKGIIGYLQILLKLIKFRRAFDILHFQHEFFLYGGILSALCFPLLLMASRVLAKPIVVTLHGVISPSLIDREFVDIHGIGINHKLVRFGFKLITRMIIRNSTGIIVHEEQLRRILIIEYGARPECVTVIPHGMEDLSAHLLQKDAAKASLKLSGFVILFFGYIAGYKGIDLLFDAFQRIDSDNYRLIIAGGRHPRLSQNPDYDKMIDDLYARANNDKRIIITGFVKEQDIATYYSAADLLVFPYRFFLSSSGPIALALSFDKPFLVSDRIGEMFKNAIPQCKLEVGDIAKQITKLANDPSRLSQLANFASQFKEDRLWSKIAILTELYYERILSPHSS